MATVYSDHYTISGLSSGGYRASLTYSTSESNTAITITWSASVQMKYAAKYGVGIQCEGKSGTGYITSSSSSYTTVKTISGTTTVNKGTSSSTKKITAKAYGTTVSGYGSAGGSTSVSASITIPALASYTVSYNANGGSGAPSSQTKYYGKTLTLSSTVPTREGYSFAGWGTSASATGVAYSAGGSYTSNASATLYAVWILNEEPANIGTIRYDMNGGSGSIVDQSHIAGTVSVLSGVKPTRDGYMFLGWSDNKKATRATYLSGKFYKNNIIGNGEVVTLYAIWKKKKDIYINLPEECSIDSIYVNIPDGHSVETVYIRTETIYAKTSNSMALFGSNGKHLTFKDG